METLKKFLLTFVLVLAGCTISSTIFITIFIWEIEFKVILLWQIIGLAVICTLGNLFFYSKYEISKKKMKIRMIFHYLYINIAVLGYAFLFQWIDPSYLVQFLVMLVLIAAVYYGVMKVDFQREEKAAENMNMILRKLNSSGKEKEE